MKLRFLARGTAHVSDFDALERSVPLRRFIGRKLAEVPGGHAFVPTGKPEECTARPELLKAAQDGDLWAADEATAKACGVKFDPMFGGDAAPSAEEG